MVCKTIGTRLAGYQNSTNLQEDESFSARPIFNFTSQTSNKAVINSTTALLVDLKTTMNTLLKTIHDTNSTAKNGNSEGFKGFNFVNFDLRSLSSLNGATGGVNF